MQMDSSSVPGNKFQYGPVWRGAYIGMLWFTIVIGWHYPNLLAYYVPLLVFLGLGLRPVLEALGLQEFFKSGAKKHVHEQRQFEIERRRRANERNKSRFKNSS